MAVSRAAVLQSLVLDESLRQFQTAAVNSVQSLASTFTGLAHALQKQKTQTTQHEQSVQKQINQLVVTINEHAATIEDLKAEQQAFSARVLDRLKYLTPDGRHHAGIGGPGTLTLLDRIRRIERALDIVDSEDDYEDWEDEGAEQQDHDSTPGGTRSRGADQAEVTPKEGDQLPSPALGVTGPSASPPTAPGATSEAGLSPGQTTQGIAPGVTQQATAGRRAGRATPLTTGSEHPAIALGPEDSLSPVPAGSPEASPGTTKSRRGTRTGAGSRPGLEDKRLPSKVGGSSGADQAGGSGTGVLSIASRIETLEYRQKQFEAFLKSQTGSHVDARLQAVLAESEPAVIKSRAEAAQRLEQMWKALERMEATVNSFTERMVQLENMVMQSSDQLCTAISEQASERTKLAEQVTEALTRLEETRTELRERTEGLQASVNAEIEEQARALGEFQQKLESKADIRLVLDKITRQEWQAVVNELRHADEEILSRAAARSEVEELVMRLRHDLTEEDQQRNANIVRIANDLKSLVSEVSSKASKSDLVDVANVLNSFPKVHADLDSLKMFVEREIASKQDLQLLQDATVTRKSLRRQLDALLKALAAEIHSGERAGLIPGGIGSLGLPNHRRNGPCTSCHTRAASTPGGTCLVCSAKLLGNVPHTSRHNSTTSSLGNPSFVPMKGGGFALTSSPRRLLTGQSTQNLDATTSLSATSMMQQQHPSHPNSTYDASPHGPSGLQASSSPRPLTASIADFISGKASSLANGQGIPSTAGADGLGGGAPGGGGMMPQTVTGTDGRQYTSFGSQTHVLRTRR